MTVPYGQRPQQPHQPQHSQYGQYGQYGQAQYGPPQYGQPQYPPPHHRPYGPPPGYPPAGPPPGYPPAGPPPPPRRGSARKIVAIVVGVLVALLLMGGFAVYQLAAGVADGIGGATAGMDTVCAAVPTEDVNAALGGTYDVVQLGGLSGVAGPVLDSRVLPDAPSCWAVESGDGGRLARIARYSGPDAAARFAAEKAAAQGTTEDKGNGISVSSEPYFAADTAAGDEAFCTTGDFIGSAGVLVRRGDLLVYVSTTAAGDGAASIPQIGLDENNKITFATDAANCAKAVALAQKVT
jgi:hypothetical protein